MGVPEEAGLGVAKVRLSFDAWKAGHVAPSSLEVPIIEPQPKVKTAEQPQRPQPKIEDSKELRQTLRHNGYIGALDYTADGRLLATLDWDRQGGDTGVHLWDAVTGRKQTEFALQPKNSEAFSLRFDPTGKRLAVATREVKLSADGHRYEGWRGWGVLVWDLAKAKEPSVFREEKPGTAVVLGFDGHFVLVMFQEGEPWKKTTHGSQLMRLDPADGKRSTIWESTERETDAASVSAEGHYAILIQRPSAKRGRTDVLLLDVKAGQTRSLWETSGSVSSAAAFTPDGKTVAVFLRNKVRFWDVATGRERTDLGESYTAFWKRPEHERLGRILTMQFSSDSKQFTVAHEVLDIPSRRVITEIVLWDLPSGKARSILRGHTSHVFNMAFSPDGRTLATGSFDKMVKLWNIPF